MEKIIAWVVTALIGVLIWYLKCQTNRQNEREDKRDKRDAEREDKILNIVDVSLKDLGKTVKEDSDNTANMTKSVYELKDVISNHLVHNIEKLTSEISRMNNKQ